MQSKGKGWEVTFDFSQVRRESLPWWRRDSRQWAWHVQRFGNETGMFKEQNENSLSLYWWRNWGWTFGLVLQRNQASEEARKAVLALCPIFNSSFSPSVPPSGLLPWVCGLVHVVDACKCVGACRGKHERARAAWNLLLSGLPYCLEVGTELDIVHFSYAGWLESSGDPSVSSPECYGYRHCSHIWPFNFICVLGVWTLTLQSQSSYTLSHLLGPYFAEFWP